MKQIAIALDQLLNALFGGYADETLSSRAYRRSVAGDDRARRVIDALFFFEEKHCYRAYLSERNRAQLPPEFRA